MKTLQSKINPDYSGTVYPIKQYKGGNGYFFHLTGSDKGIPPIDIPKDVKDELKPLLVEAWNK